MAAVCVYRLRMVDMSIREHVLLMWIIEGERHLRAHEGTLYQYIEVGAWQPWRGFPSEERLARVKQFFLFLEGVFRRISPDTKREDRSLRKAIDTIYRDAGSLQELEFQCVDASIFNIGQAQKGRGRGRGKGQGKGKEEGLDVLLAAADVVADEPLHRDRPA